ncbi:hypothetical protein SAMN02910384_00928 [Pseudobutyrivibrio sp. ACV-2]|uniref:hypothetical protein n=1 Tax=Pseudobutyrivibrio sp. ACV-2 TaxID=1520801 RepID=UPI000897A258|nr:hypothetical protein [Pseudobutyrivibrio sp. ACV-2]SEA16733.1 hypothetical protein SAMN02910384_00928 [Pseudobutyrivibrio sp. ACV-2]
MTKVNREYKDRLFRLLFGTEEMKENILQLYNALNGSNYEDASELELTTIEDVIYIRMKNDVSFLFDSFLSVWEQQSSFNPNMPVRGLMYFGMLYEQYIKSHGINVYSRGLKKIPTPRYIVFYNGLEDRPPIEKLRLSDAFINEDKSGDFEWTATGYNLNKGKNERLLEKCKPLREYMELINRIRINSFDYDIEKAVDLAVDSCIKDGILKDFLEKHKAEVSGMVLTEFDEKVFVDDTREEARTEEKLENIKKLMNKLSLTAEKAMEVLDVPKEDYDKFKAML